MVVRPPNDMRISCGLSSRARTNLRCAGAIGDQCPGGARAIRPVGCMRGLGRTCSELRLPSPERRPQRGQDRSSFAHLCGV